MANAIGDIPQIVADGKCGVVVDGSDPESICRGIEKLAGDAEYFSVRGFSVSPDGNTAVYGVDTAGRRFYDLYFMDIDSGEILPDAIEDTTANVAWANDNQTLLYGKQHPETLRSYQVLRHQLGSGCSDNRRRAPAPGVGSKDLTVEDWSDLASASFS